MAKKIMRLAMDEWLLISDVQIAAEEYMAEVENPAPDLSHRAYLRDRLAAACGALRIYRRELDR